MELVPIVDCLWRRRVVVAVGIALAVVLGWMVGSRTTATRTGTASTWVTLDTPDSQLVRVDPPGLDTLAWRAALIAHLMASDKIVARIAARTGIGRDKLVVVDPALDVPDAPTTLPLAAAGAAAIRPEPYSATLRFDPTLPIISVEGHAPDRAGAIRLVNAVRDELIAQSDTHAGSRFIDFRVETTQATRSAEVVVDHAKLITAVAILFLVMTWISAVVLVSWLAELLRARRSGRFAAELL